MDLAALHLKFSKDANYRKAYDECGPLIELAIACAAIREERSMTKKELAAATGATVSSISAFENFVRFSPVTIDVIVRLFAEPLKRRGVNTSKWILPMAEGSSKSPIADLVSGSRRLSELPSTRIRRGSPLLDRRSDIGIKSK